MKDRLIGLFGIIVSLILFLDIRDAAFRTKVFPIACIVVFFAFSVALVFRKNQKRYEFAQLGRIVVSIGIILAYMLGMKYLGFLSATIAFMLAFTLYNRAKIGYAACVIYSLLYPTAIYMLFKVLLNVRLPKGILI